jgi:hemerythrin-like domain-containing protein
MQPTGNLMIEHRLIERMIALLRGELDGIRDGAKPDLRFLDRAVDFIQTYADRTHHGKEEDILFRDLSGKELSATDRAATEELTHEHAWARERVGELADTLERAYGGGDFEVTDLVRPLEQLTEFYPRHIEREDKVFFPALMGYLTDREQEAMIREFEDFDRGLVHRRYRGVVESLEKRPR